MKNRLLYGFLSLCILSCVVGCQKSSIEESDISKNKKIVYSDPSYEKEKCSETSTLDDSSSIIIDDNSNEKDERYDETNQWEEKQKDRINKNAPIHIGMNKNDVYDELCKTIDSSEIMDDDGDYVVEMTNNQAAQLFDVEAVKALPTIEDVSLLFNDNKLNYIDVHTPLPSETSSTDSSPAAIEKSIKLIASNMGIKDEVTVRGQHGSYSIYRGTVEIDSVRITIFISDRLDGVDVRLYSNF